MQIRINGNAATKLRALRAQLSDPRSLLQSISKNLAEETLELVRQGFEKEEDPYGEAWAPLKYRDGKILQDTGRLRSSWHTVTVSERGFSVAPAVDYAQYHQSGTARGLPKRRMVPDEGLPDEWKRRFSELVNQILRDHFSGH
jgi:phage gpG-like protein